MFVIRMRSAVVAISALIVPVVVCGCGSKSPMSGPKGIVVNEETPLPTNGFLGLKFESIETTPLVIQGTVPGSHAEELAILPGDVLSGIADISDPNIETVFEILNKTKPGDKIEIAVRRNGSLYRFDLELMSYEEIQSAMEQDAASRGSTEVNASNTHN